MIYAASRLYARAFSYRDFAAESQFLREQFRALKKREARSFCEFACGPADHSVELAAAGLDGLAVDIEPSMVELVDERIQARALETKLRAIAHDMRRPLDERVDLAFTLLDSTAHLLSTDDMVDHLSAVRTCLENDGVYVLEMAHPGDVFSVSEKTKSEWTIQDDDGALTVRWEPIDGTFDPISQCEQVAIHLEPEHGDAIQDRIQLRRWTAQELGLHCRIAGLQIIQQYGAFDSRVPLDSSERSWRMISLLTVGT
ncbi:MAG: class I SAM-dependent methyltransferase [Myxococcota bacterium]